MAQSQITYSVVIPVYNTVGTLEQLEKRISSLFDDIVQATFEIIFVDDASPNPKTWPMLEQLSQQNTRVVAIQLTRNFGQSAATVCGLTEAKGKWVITMDDDLQHRPEDISQLISKKGHDIVVGRLQRNKHNWFKRLSSHIKGLFDRVVLKKPKGIALSSFRMLNRTVVDGVLATHTPYPFIPAMMFHISKDIVNVDVRHEKRKEGKTGYTLSKMIHLFSNLIINNSALMLKAMGYVGISISIASLGFAGYLVWRKLVLKSVAQGWTSTIVAILFMGGLQLFATGVIGEYLIRIIQGVERKPTYFIRHRRQKK